MSPRDVVDFIRSVYGTNKSVGLHEPSFAELDHRNVAEALTSTFVSSVGPFVDQFERDFQKMIGCSRAVATVNGTAALHTALHLVGVRPGDMVITQALNFVAGCNVIHQLHATPAFVDVSEKTLGMCPDALSCFLHSHAIKTDRDPVFEATNQRIKAVIPMHTFGHPVDMESIKKICDEWRIPIVEDAAESLGSTLGGTHTGTFGRFGAFSFNGNKVITTGGGGMLVCNDVIDGVKAKHVTTTAKIEHPYEFIHDEPGFNYRLPNLNAALGCSQLAALQPKIKLKRQLARIYRDFFEDGPYQFVDEPEGARSNFWLNAVICEDFSERELLISMCHKERILVRPIWTLMNKLPMFGNAPRGSLTVSEWLADRVVNLPSSPVCLKMD